VVTVSELAWHQTIPIGKCPCCGKEKPLGILNIPWADEVDEKLGPRGALIVFLGLRNRILRHLMMMPKRMTTQAFIVIAPSAAVNSGMGELPAPVLKTMRMMKKKLLMTS
jgi:hypothetical protein